MPKAASTRRQCRSLSANIQSFLAFNGVVVLPGWSCKPGLPTLISPNSPSSVCRVDDEDDNEHQHVTVDGCSCWHVQRRHMHAVHGAGRFGALAEDGAAADANEADEEAGDGNIKGEVGSKFLTAFHSRQACTEVVGLTE